MASYVKTMAHDVKMKDSHVKTKVIDVKMKASRLKMIARHVKTMDSLCFGYRGVVERYRGVGSR